jgi:hypothetical protein
MKSAPVVAGYPKNVMETGAGRKLSAPIRLPPVCPVLERFCSGENEMRVRSFWHLALNASCHSNVENNMGAVQWHQRQGFGFGWSAL